MSPARRLSTACLRIATRHPQALATVSFQVITASLVYFAVWRLCFTASVSNDLLAFLYDACTDANHTRCHTRPNVLVCSGSIKAEAIIADMIRASTPFGMAALAHAQHFRSSPNHSLAAMTSPVSAHDASFSSSTASIDSAGSKRDWAQVRGLHRRQHDINPYVESACTEYV